MQMSLVAFQRAQEASLARQKTVVEGVRLAADEEYHEYARMILYPEHTTNVCHFL